MARFNIAFNTLILLVLSICMSPCGAQDAWTETGNNAVVMAFQKPNLFELRGAGTAVTFSTSSFNGQPLLTYRDRKHNLTFQGDEIRQFDSEMGLQVTVTIEEVPDLHGVTFTLLLPRINLEGAEIPFRTKAIITTHRTSIGGPDLVKGVLQTYIIRELVGKGRFVVF
jgi:hypothetical protein